MSDAFSIFQYQFFQHALAAAILTSVIAAMVGTYIVSRKIVFIGGGITHASFGGIGLAFYMGLNPFFGSRCFWCDYRPGDRMDQPKWPGTGR